MRPWATPTRVVVRGAWGASRGASADSTALRTPERLLVSAGPGASQPARASARQRAAFCVFFEPSQGGAARPRRRALAARAPLVGRGPRGSEAGLGPVATVSTQRPGAGGPAAGARTGLAPARRSAWRPPTAPAAVRARREPREPPGVGPGELPGLVPGTGGVAGGTTRPAEYGPRRPRKTRRGLPILTAKRSSAARAWLPVAA